MLARLASRRRADLTRARAPAPSPPATGVSMPPRAAPARAPVRPRPRREPAPPRAVADDEALLAELGGSDAEEPNAGEPDAEESMEALERRLRGELATMADGMAEDEAALRRDLDAMGDEEGGKGCGCTSTDAHPAASLLLLGLLAVRRRRRAS